MLRTNVEGCDLVLASMAVLYLELHRVNSIEEVRVHSARRNADVQVATAVHVAMVHAHLGAVGNVLNKHWHAVVTNTRRRALH